MNYDDDDEIDDDEINDNDNNDDDDAKDDDGDDIIDGYHVFFLQQHFIL